MSVELIGVIGLVVLIILIFIGVYVSVAMAIVGFVGAILITGSSIALSYLYSVPFAVLKDPNFAVLTLFVVMSEFISLSGIGREAFDAVRAWLGQIRGGMAMAAVGACGLFAATSGSSMACAVVMGKVAYPEMRRFNYSSTLAIGCIAAGGSVGIMIPPSMPFVIIGIMTNLSIGKLFIAGILPGITEVLFYFITIYILCKINPRLGPTAPNLPLKQKIYSTRLTWPIAIIFIIVIGGIYMGVFTPTESAAIGAFAALVMGFSRRQLDVPGVKKSLESTINVTGMMLLTLTCAYILNKFLAISRIPFVTSDFINGLGFNTYITLIIILLIYVIIGMFFDIMPVLILTIPIIFPTILDLGLDPIWYSVLMCRVAEIGFVTPPFGINLFGIHGVVGIPMGDIFRGVIPFVIADFCHVAFLIAFPQVATFLPSIMR